MQDSRLLRDAALAQLQAHGMQVPESSWLSLNKRDDLSRALQAGSWGGLCSGDIVHVITIPPPSSPLGLPSENTPLSSSPAERHSSETQTPPVASVVAVAASHTESLVVATASFSPASHVLQSLVVALGLPHPHIRVLRDGSAAARGVDAAHDFSAVAAVVGTAVCILVSSAGGVCTAQLPLLFAATVDAPSDRARDEAWKQLLQQAHAVIRPNSISKKAADALSQVAPFVNERAHAAVSRDAALSQLGPAGLLAAAVLCICSTVDGASAAMSYAVDQRRQLLRFSIRTLPAAATCDFSCAVLGGSLLVQSVLGSRSGAGSLSIAAYVGPDGNIRKSEALVHNVALQLLRPLFVLQCGGPGVSLADLPHEVLVLVCDQLPPRNAALLARCCRNLCSASSSSLAQRRQAMKQRADQLQGQPVRVRSSWGGSGHWVAPPMFDDYPSPQSVWLRNQLNRVSRSVHGQ